MTTEQQWFPIPDFSCYEINREGDVRIKLGYPIPDYLDSKTRLLKPMGVDYVFYHMVEDGKGLCAALRDDLLHETFHPNTENLGYLDRNEGEPFLSRWAMYRGLRNEGELDWLLSDECSPRWNEFFADVKDWDDNLDDEGRFHASLHIYGWNCPDSWHRMMEATRACLLLGFATPEDARQWDWLRDDVEDAFELNDPNGGQYDVKDLTMEQAWDWTISFCQRPFRDSGEKFWALWCLDAKFHDYPDWQNFALSTKQYVQSQPFEVLEEYIQFIISMDELEMRLGEDEFESLTHFKHYTPEWDERFKALVPGWEPYNPED